MNPEYFDIENLKMFGMWPHQSFISRGITPYIKRIRKDKATVLFVGDNKGEQTIDLLDLCGDRLQKISSIRDSDDELIEAIYKKNTKGRDEIVDTNLEESFDVVCINEHSCTEETLSKYYDLVPSNGIFCGNGHETVKVKQALTNFRRSSKIGTPIQIANRSIWFWHKR